MKAANFIKSAVSPFLEGIARNFDFACSMDVFPLPPPQDNDPNLYDWQMVSSDYDQSIKIIDEELNDIKKTPGK
jgi:hypothetical protein